MKKTGAIDLGAEHQRIEFSSNDFKIVVLNQLSNNLPKSFHEEIEIKYFYLAGSRIMVGSDILDVKVGDIVVINPYEMHANVNLAQEPVMYYSIVIDVDFLFANGVQDIDLRRILLEDGKRFTNLIRDNKRLQAIITRTFEEMQAKKEHYRIIVKGLMIEFFALLVRDYLTGAENEGEALNVKKAEVILPALSKIHTDYNKKININELAELCSISKFYFCRTFKQVMGVSPAEYVINYRLRLADVMLKDGTETLFKIARLCGFQDESYFCRCYKKRRGVSPKRHRD